jgi:mRNA interferase RelE/StbE
MNIEFDKSFHKSLDKINDKTILKKLPKIFEAIEQAEKIKDISNIKKISGYSNYYRVKSGNYRIGIELFHENTIRFIIISHRKDIYNKFPK